MPKKPLSNTVNRTKSFSDIQQEWKKIQSLEIRDRFKLMRTISHDISETYKTKGANLEELSFFIEVLKEVNRIHAIPRSKQTLSKMTLAWLELKGLANAKIIKKMAGKINCEGGSIAIGDSYYVENIIDKFNHYTEKNVVDLINQGQACIFSTGADGTHNVQIRIIDSPEPVLSSKEFQCVINSTETVIIHFPTGVINVADPFFLDEESNRLSVKVEPGNYKVSVYFFYIHLKVESFYIVLCKTNEEAKNNLSKFPALG